MFKKDKSFSLARNKDPARILHICPLSPFPHQGHPSVPHKKKNHPRAGEMAIKHLLHNCEDLSSNPQNPQRESGVLVHACNPESGHT